MPFLRCANCKHFERIPVIKYQAIGLGISGFGVFGWFSFLFAGSGHAFFISCTIVIIGIYYILMAKNIAINAIKETRCSNCNQIKWDEIPYKTKT